MRLFNTVNNLAITKLLIRYIICFVIAFVYDVSFNKIKALSIQWELAELSSKIIDNRVQIKLIDNYIDNLTQIYQKKVTTLQHKNIEFATSVTILYNLTINPREILLVENLSKAQTINTFVVINYWLKSATTTIYKIYLELEAIKNTTKKLNQAKLKLIALNKQLATNQKQLNELLTKNQINKTNVNQINNIRANLKYSSMIANKNKILFDKINQPILTEQEETKDKEFIKNNKGKLLWPSSGYLYSDYKNSKYYSLNYYGIVLIATSKSKIISPADGEIIFCDTLDKYNMVIMIKHSPSFISVISGDFTSIVKLSQKIKKGETIATIGTTTKPIYFELNKAASPIAPKDWLSKKT